MSSLSTNVTKLESQCVFLELLNREKCLYLAPVISSSQNALSKIKFPNKLPSQTSGSNLQGVNLFKVTQHGKEELGSSSRNLEDHTPH